MPAAVEGDLPAVLDRKIHIHLQCQIRVQNRTDGPVGVLVILVEVFAFVSVGIGLGDRRETDRRTRADTEMRTIIKRHIHIPVCSDGGPQNRVISQIQIARSDADGSIVPLLEAMPPAGGQKLHRERRSRHDRSGAKPRRHFLVRQHE